MPRGGLRHVPSEGTKTAKVSRTQTGVSATYLGCTVSQVTPGGFGGPGPWFFAHPK